MAATIAGSSAGGVSTNLSCDGAVIGDVVAPISNIKKKHLNEEEDSNLDSVVSSTSNSLYFATEPAHTSTPKPASTADGKNHFQQFFIDKANKHNNYNKKENLEIATGTAVLNFKQLTSSASNSSHDKYNQHRQHTFLNKYKGVSTLLVVDKQLLALAIAFALTVIIYKMVLVAVPFANSDSVSDFALFTQHKFKQSLNWFNEAVNRFDANDWRSSVTPLLCGLVVSIISIGMVYLDSNKPGINPPSPMTPTKTQSYYRQRNSSLYLSYITAITSGLVVSALMYFEY